MIDPTLHAACCTLPGAAHCVLHGVCRVVYAACCMVRVVCRVLYAACCASLGVARCMLWQVLVLALSALTVTAVSLVLPMPQLLSGERLGFLRYRVHWHVQVGIRFKRECHARVRVCVCANPRASRVCARACACGWK